jgi:hypothetical protein
VTTSYLIDHYHGFRRLAGRRARYSPLVHAPGCVVGECEPRCAVPLLDGQTGDRASHGGGSSKGHRLREHDHRRPRRHEGHLGRRLVLLPAARGRGRGGRPSAMPYKDVAVTCGGATNRAQWTPEANQRAVK